MSRPMEERFWEKVSKTDSCWLWTGFKTRKGYGRLRLTDLRKSRSAHRIAWFLAHGEWPVLQVLHTCDVPSCVRPDHLFLGTHDDNMRDKAQKGRQSGELSPKAKLSNEEAFFMRLQHSIGATPAALALLYEVKRSVVYAVLSGRAYRSSRLVA